MIGHITYLSNDVMNQKFGRQLREGLDIEVQHAGHRVPDRELSALPGRQVQHATSMPTPICSSPGRSTILILPAALAANLAPGATPRAQAKFSADQLYHRLALCARALRARSSRRCSTTAAQVSYAEIDAPHGHDAFLLDDPRYMGVMRSYFENIATELTKEGV